MHLVPKCDIKLPTNIMGRRQMNTMDIAKAIDIHNFLDRLEEVSDIQNYYRINHLSPDQRDLIARKIAESLTVELQAMGLKIEVRA
ncbi:MAG: hypothetical protein Kow0029_08870 [Candidatus Rifleibacteriota bacterium]